MTGFILAAGFGTRLADVTPDIPKPLVPVGGRPMIDHAIERLCAAGCTRIVINTHHHAEQLERHFRAAPYPVEIILTPEETILGTGGAILHAAPFLAGEEHFLVHNADIASECDPAALLESQREAGGLATLLVRPQPGTRALLVRNDGTLIGKESWPEAAGHPEAALRVGFCGIHAISSGIFRLGFDLRFVDIFDLYREAMSEGYRVQTLAYPGYWTDLGTTERIRRHESWLAKRV